MVRAGLRIGATANKETDHAQVAMRARDVKWCRAIWGLEILAEGNSVTLSLDLTKDRSVCSAMYVTIHP